MLSVLNTLMGLTIVGPNGKTLRFPTKSPLHSDAASILKKGYPAEQAWEALATLTENPLKPFLDWLNSYGCVYRELNDDLFSINDVVAPKQWLKKLKYIQESAGSPIPLVSVMKDLGSKALQVLNADSVCVHAIAVAGMKPQLIQFGFVDPDANLGDKVESLSATGKGVPCFVTHNQYTPSNDGNLVYGHGVLLDKFENRETALEILKEPIILGHNRTYQCEEGDTHGWLEENSFDSLAAARCNLKAIKASGYDARIVNRITNSVVP